MSKYYTGILPPLPSENKSKSKSTNRNNSYNPIPFACVEGQYKKGD